MDASVHEALRDIGEYLKDRRYDFTAVTPVTHQRVLDRDIFKNEDILRNLFGWNVAVPARSIPEVVLKLMYSANVAELADDEKIRSLVRFSTLEDSLYLHSEFPTVAKDSVFFGPDTYRFIRFLHRVAEEYSKVLDIGCGSGAGGLSLAPAEEIWLSDVNCKALDYARINASLSGVENVSYFESDLFKSIPPGADLIVANPPFIQDEERRHYRDGGACFGSELSIKMVEDSVRYLRESGGGQLVMYTGSCIVGGRDIFLEGIRDLLRDHFFIYEEIDPDIFGEELVRASYRDVERIAAVGLSLHI